MSETKTMKLVRMAAAEVGARLFRQNTALAWVGRIASKTPKRIVIEDPRPLHAGLCVGSSDIIGWTPVVVTKEMVGSKLAIFTAIEIKEGRTAIEDEQEKFVNAVVRDGGLAMIVRVKTPEEAAGTVAAMLRGAGASR